MKAFDFGENWRNYARLMDEERIVQAERGVAEAVGVSDLSGKTFVDIGCGSGIHSVAAARLGAAVTCVDVNPKCLAETRRSFARFAPKNCPPAERFLRASILDAAEIEPLGKFDIVYSWGVLHHTGDMRLAFENAAKLVAPGGCFVNAIYNRHWSSGFWQKEKALFVHSPRLLQGALVYSFYGVIALAKLVVTRRNPFRKERGMDFYYDVIDWLGGYPYEYASEREVIRFFEKRGLRCEWSRAAEVPTGCNEFRLRAPHEKPSKS